jgi:hypothetical protein
MQVPSGFVIERKSRLYVRKSAIALNRNPQAVDSSAIPGGYRKGPISLGMPTRMLVPDYPLKP